MTWDAAQWQRWSDAIARQHSIHVEERAHMPAGIEAFSTSHNRTIIVKPFAAALSEDVLLRRAADRSHEFGHIIDGPCPQRGDGHFADLRTSGYLRCVQCETNAWRIGYSLLPELCRAVQHRVRGSLLLSRVTTLAMPEAGAAAKALASDSCYASTVLARMAHQTRLDAIAEIQEIAAEAARPRPLKRWQRQYAEIRQIAMEARNART